MLPIYFSSFTVAQVSHNDIWYLSIYFPSFTVAQVSYNDIWCLSIYIFQFHCCTGIT